MSSVKSPYNFVPAPDESEVFQPDWADQVSHDIPFSDGESGEIELKITAETPIFIRNGHSGDQQEPEFSHYYDMKGNRQYFIPATSIKGMLRNVFEILSFSRLKPMNNHRHAIRQIMKKKGAVIDEGYELSGEKRKEIRAGYLVESNGSYRVFDCGIPYKIRFNELDSRLETDFERQFGLNPTSNMNADFSARTGRYKYLSVIGGRELEHFFEIHPLDGEGEQSWKSKFQHLDYVQFSSDRKNGSFQGRIVCVGQASTYEVPTSRRGEYVFKGRKADVLIDESRSRRVPDSVMGTFLFINRHNQGENEELEDWKYWKYNLEEGIPVFYRMDEDNRAVLDMGLSFMYKQPVKYSTQELLSSEKKAKIDMAETVLGNVGDTGLKGRVIPSHFKLFGEAKVLTETSFLLASPKSSYVPFYLKQSGTSGKSVGYNTYNTRSTLRGFKRYPVRSNSKIQNTDGLNGEMLSQCRPLAVGSAFIGKIRFQNLRKFEIGALLSSITLHNSTDSYHSIGGIKPFGYGRVKVEVTSFKGCRFEQNEYLRVFELGMRMHSVKWCDVVRELLTICSIPENMTENNLEYMELKNFQIVKEKGEFLRSYSEIVESTKKVRFLCDSSELLELSNTIELKRKQAQRSLEQNEFAEAEAGFREVKSMQPKFNLEEKLALINVHKNEHMKAVRDEQIFGDILVSKDKQVIGDYIRQNPFHKRISELQQLVSTLKAVEGIPERLKKLDDFTMFYKETIKWKEKVQRTSDFDQFIPEVSELIEKIIRIELNISKLSKSWQVELKDRKSHWLKVERLIGEEMCKRLYEVVIKER